jgi:transmembrane sensor
MKKWTLARTEQNQQILDEAAEWFVDVREDDLDARGQKEFVAWLRRSPDHIKAYLEVAAFWADAPQLAAKGDVDVEALIAYARADDNVIPLGDAVPRANETHATGTRATERRGDGHETEKASSSRPLKRGMRGILPLAAAASVVALGVAAGSWIWATRGETYATAIGEQRSVTLADGSTIDMNAKSRIRIRFDERARDVELLEGQALFTVARDPARPFVVSSDDTRVRAVGTQFVVYRRKSGTTVTVLEGKVSVVAAATNAQPRTEPELRPRPESAGESAKRGGEAAIYLTAGEQVLMSPSVAIAPKPADLAVAKAWTQRQVIFQGAPLTDVVEEFNRYNLRQMVILDGDLADVRVSGVFSSTQPASLLRFLREQVGLAVSERADAVEISRR